MKKQTLKATKELTQEFLNDTFAPDLPKRNKKHYEKWILKVSNLLDLHRDYMTFKLDQCKKQNHFPENFNTLYDQEYALENLRDDIQRWCWKRDWTFQDFQQAKLVSMNID